MPDNTRTLTIPKTLTRQGEIVIEERQGDNPPAKRVSISSDEPYLRYDYRTGEHYWEVLGHGPGDIDEGRLKLGLTMLYNHRRDDHLGRAKSYNNNGRKLDVGTMDDLIWSHSEFAQTKKKDVEIGALVGTSVGYSIGEGEEIGEKDGYPIVKFRWAPHEFSFCTIEADTSVGAGRQRSADDDETETVEVFCKQRLTSKPTTDTTPETKAMPEPTTPSGSSSVIVKSEAEIRAEVTDKVTREFEAEQSRKEAITSLATRFVRYVDNETRDSFLRTKGRPVSELQTIILEKQGATPIEVAGPKSEGMKQRDIENYSILRGINGVLNGKLDGLEREMSDDSAKTYGRQASAMGFFIPQDVLNHRTLFAGNFASAGALVQTGPQGQSMIDLYRNKMNVIAMGAQVLGGLQGDLAIPRQTGGATAYWLAEDATVTATNQTVGQLSLRPHRLSGCTEYGRQFLLQSSVDAEAFVRNDLMTVLAIEKDRAALLGTGAAGEPLGIYNTPNIATTVDITATSSITYAEAVQFETNVASQNADVGSLGYLTSIYIRASARITAKFASTATPLWDKDMLANHKAMATNQLTAVPSVIFGNWNDLIIGEWGTPEVTVDPYSLAKADLIRIVMRQFTDIGIRHPKSFCFGVV